MKRLMLVLTLALVACVQTPDVTTSDPHMDDTYALTVQSIRYAKDVRTGLCFAVAREYSRGGYGAGIATVPCDSVEKQISIWRR